MFSGEALIADLSSRSTIPNQPPTIYRIDRTDRIVYVDEAWNEFARQNGAEGLLTRVLGRNLWEFVSGRELKRLYFDWFSRIRASGTSARLNFRCDAPDRERLMEIEISPRLGGVVEIRCQTIAERPRPTLYLLTDAPARSNALLTLCSLCKRAKVNKEWLELEEAVQRLGLIEGTPMPMINHGICQVCTDQINGQINGTRNRGLRRLR
jgi:hypothetical protein